MVSPEARLIFSESLVMRRWGESSLHAASSSVLLEGRFIVVLSKEVLIALRIFNVLFVNKLVPWAGFNAAD